VKINIERSCSNIKLLDMGKDKDHVASSSVRKGGKSILKKKKEQEN
jgi:hypothetical protein